MTLAQLADSLGGMRPSIWLASLFVALILVGCDDEDDTPEPAEPGYTLHEWGLVDVDLTTSRAEYAAGPGRFDIPREAPPRPRPRPLRKPVLYFHLTDPATPVTFDLSVRLAAAGRVIEHFPAGAVEGGILRWTGVTLAHDSCPGGPYPSQNDPICDAVEDGYCESAELNNYVASDAGCLTVDGRPQNFLFYRGEGSTPALPLSFQRAPDGRIIVRNESLPAPAGALLRLRHTGEEIRVAQVGIPARGESTTLGLPTELASEAHAATLREQLRSIGLTGPEAQAFENAWFGEFFDPAASTPHGFPDALVFFLPQDSVDFYARLEATPPPSQTVRAMAIRAGWPTL